MKLDANVKNVARKILKEALKETSSNGDLTNLKLLFPGCDDIPLRLAALLTDTIPSDTDNHSTLIENAIADASAAFADGMEDWHNGKIHLHEVLARYTFALFQRSANFALWAVTFKHGEVWEYPNPPLLASQYDAIAGVYPRSQPTQPIKTQRLLEELLTDREKKMMRLEAFLSVRTG
jgi:hypothetical protein